MSKSMSLINHRSQGITSQAELMMLAQSRVKVKIL